MQIIADNKEIIYTGPSGYIVLFNFGCGETPPEEIESRVIADNRNPKTFPEMAQTLADNKFAVVPAPIKDIILDENNRIKNIQSACVVITNDETPTAYTNISNPMIFAGVMIPFLSSTIEKADTGDNGQAQKMDGTANALADIPEDVLFGNNVPKEIMGEIRQIARELEYAQNTVKNCISTELFVNGMLVLTCSSKKEYISMKKYLADHGCVVSKSVNANEWNDLCKYVYAKALPEDEILVINASFHMPKTADRIMAFADFKREQDEVLRCARICSEAGQRAAALKESLTKNQ